MAKRRTRTESSPEVEQIDALGRQLANVMWNGGDDVDFTTFAIDQLINREDTTFWNSRRRQLALMVALSELAYTIGRRYPVRDQFILKPKMNPEDIIA